MTVSVTPPRNEYTGTGALDEYDYTFRIFAASDLRVTTRNTAGVETALVLNTDYTVTGVNQSTGGTITLLAGNLTTDYVLTIRFDRTPQQSTDLRNQGAFYAEVHESKFDELTRYIQSLSDETQRSIHQPETEDPADYSMELPGYAERASKFLAFDAEGNPIASEGGLTSPPVTAFATTLLDDANASTARTTLGAAASTSPTINTTIILDSSNGPTLALNTTHATNKYAVIDFRKNTASMFSMAVDHLLAGTTNFTIRDEDANVDRLVIESTGAISIPAGQLKFPATQNASSDANTLDDYEEFDWTPSVGGTATYTQREGKGTKTGRQVHLHGEMVINVIGTGSTSVISGIPAAYTHRTTVPTYGAVGQVYVQSLSQNVVSVVARIASGGVTVNLESMTAAGASHAGNAIMGNGTVIVFDITYFTD